jgi:hypothetical protein
LPMRSGAVDAALRGPWLDSSIQAVVNKTRLRSEFIMLWLNG